MVFVKIHIKGIGHEGPRPLSPSPLPAGRHLPTTLSDLTRGRESALDQPGR